MALTPGSSFGLGQRRAKMGEGCAGSRNTSQASTALQRGSLASSLVYYYPSKRLVQEVLPRNEIRGNGFGIGIDVAAEATRPPFSCCQWPSEVRCKILCSQPGYSSWLYAGRAGMQDQSQSANDPKTHEANPSLQSCACGGSQ